MAVGAGGLGVVFPTHVGVNRDPTCNANNLQRGKWCPKCLGTPELDLARLREVARRRGGRCLATQFLGGKEKHAWQCRVGHVLGAAPSLVIGGTWCPECAFAGGAVRPPLSILDMQRTAAARGGECLSASYDASYDQRVKVLWRCGLGHEWAATASSVRSGSWCPVCARRYRGSIDGLKLLAADRGGQLLTTFYEGKRVPLRWSCARGHSFELTSGAAKSGAWCPRCPRDREPPPLREIASSQTGSATARSERQAGPESSGA